MLTVDEVKRASEHFRFGSSDYIQGIDNAKLESFLHEVAHIQTFPLTLKKRVVVRDGCCIESSVSTIYDKHIVCDSDVFFATELDALAAQLVVLRSMPFFDEDFWFRRVSVDLGLPNLQRRVLRRLKYPKSHENAKKIVKFVKRWSRK